MDTNQSTLTSLLDATRHQIEEHLVVGKARWPDLVARIAAAELSGTEDFDDEQAWTFLVAAGYAAAGVAGVTVLSQQLTGSPDCAVADDARIWFEMLPMSPRMRESNTNLDLAVGSIRRRGKTKSGIELDPGPGSWVCFVEARWYSDLSKGVEHHPERNQLARVAENAACFQSEDVVVGRPIATLLTPRRFRDGPVRSRWYRDKFDEYVADPSKLSAEWDHVSDQLPPRSQPSWQYPTDATHLAHRLRFNWVTYEELIDELPDSPLRDPIGQFAAQAGRRVSHQAAS